MTDEHPWMSKDLLVRLRWWAFKFCGRGEQENLASDAMFESVNRIEKLEAALREIATPDWIYDAPGVRDMARKALEGKDD